MSMAMAVAMSIAVFIAMSASCETANLRFIEGPC